MMWTRIWKKTSAKSKKEHSSPAKGVLLLPKSSRSLSLEEKCDYKIKLQSSGIIWRLDQIFSRQAQSSKEKYDLLQFCQQKLGLGLSREEQKGESLIHSVIASFPNNSDEFESHKHLTTRIIEILIADDCNILKPNKVGDPPIIAAYKLGNSSVLQGFFNKHAAINLVDRYGTTFLILACKINDYSTVKRMLFVYGKKLSIDAEDFSQNCALSYATLNDNFRICKLLLEAGANPNASYTPPVYQAARNDCSTEVIKLLIDHGAAVNVWVDFTGLNTLITAANKNRTDVVRLLINAGAHFPSVWHSNKSFMSALKWDNLQMTLLFLDKSVDIISKTSKGTNIIHEVSSMGSKSCLEYLIHKTDIDLNLLDRYGRTAFFKAAENGHSDCLKLLFKANVRCLQRDCQGLSPLEVAIFNDRKECVDFILNNLVCTKSVLINIGHLLRTDYDQAAFRQMTAVNALQDFISDNESVSSLLDNCIIQVKEVLGQRNSSKINVLPLPSRIKNMLR